MHTATIKESGLTISGIHICFIECEYGELKPGYKLISSDGYEWEVVKSEPSPFKKGTIPDSVFDKFQNGIIRIYEITPVGHSRRIPVGQIVTVVQNDTPSEIGN
jgi:hypothetical protein